MEDLHRLNSGTCTELERLAAAAATMGYSESLVAAHQPSLSVSAPVIQHQFPAEHFQRQYARNDAHPRPMFEQVPRPPPTAHHQPAPPAHAPPTQTIQYITDRSAHFCRNQFVTMVDMQYTNPPTIITTATQPEPQYQQAVIPERIEPPPPQPPDELGGSSVKKKKVTAGTSSKKRKNENRVKEEAREVPVNDSKFKDSGVVEVPSPVEDPEGGGLVWPCVLCNSSLPSAEAWQDHQLEHPSIVNKRRNGLSLEVKIEIIKRINGGEKQSDMAEEYMVNRSTIKSIMKKASSYLQCWKKGMFHPDSKRLKGPKREDMEAALYTWYRQAISSGIPVSGAILCSKALAFASKLGHTDFKATHGWLDRFKKRKNIVFGRTPARRKREEEESGSSELKPNAWLTSVVPQLLVEYEAGDIFAVAEVGFLYRVLPGDAPSVVGERCSGGVRSRQRLTVLLCCNMSGLEKFPLLVVGKYSKPSSFRHVKSLPVQYIANQKAWMTSDSFGAWLQDVDSWFVQQGRRVVVIASHLPIHSKSPVGLRSVQLVISPQGCNGPLRHGVVSAFKRNYRRGILETLLNQFQRDDPCGNKRVKRLNTKITLLTCLHQLSAAWHSLTDANITGSFSRAGITKGYWNALPPMQEQSMGAENLTLLHRLQTMGLNIPDMTFEDYVHFDDEVQICNLNNDDDILAMVTGADKDDDVKYDDEEDDDEENKEKGDKKEAGPSTEEVEAALATLRKHIQYQEGAQEMFRVLAHLEYLIHKGQAGTKGIAVQPTTPNVH